MTSACLPWLPRNAIQMAAERMPMREMVAAWTAKWFVRADVDLSACEEVGHDECLSDTAVALEGGLVFATSDASPFAVGRFMFGDPEGQPTPADHTAIDAAAERALADLRRRTAAMVGLPPDAVWSPCADHVPARGYRFRIMLGKAHVTIRFADRLLIANLKAQFSPAAPRPLGAFADALAPVEIRLSALLGQCRLSTIELTALSAGDVLILDRQLTDAATLAVNAVPQTTRCRIVANGARLDLSLV